MTPLSTYFFTACFSLARFSVEARARIRLGDPHLLVVRHVPLDPKLSKLERWWLCEFLGDFETLGSKLNADHRIAVQVVCDANWYKKDAPWAALPWVDSRRVCGVDWEALLQALSPDVPPRACKNNLP